VIFFWWQFALGASQDLYAVGGVLEGDSQMLQEPNISQHNSGGRIGLSGIPPTMPSSLAPAPPTRAGPENVPLAAFSKSVPPR
jgi:hypothetical protein